MKTTISNHVKEAKLGPHLVLMLWLSLTLSCAAMANDSTSDYESQKADAENFFKKKVTPFIKKYCLQCHRNQRPTEAGVNFSPALKSPAHPAFSEQWRKAAARVKAHDMPPDGLEQPSDEERKMFLEWREKVKYLSPKDPGAFVIRRLTKTEYGNTLRDLFGVDPSIADELPDEVSGEGYLNSLSPLQLEQYLAIAGKVVNQIVAPTGNPAPKVQRSLFGTTPAADADARETAREVASSLARKAYRRPATEKELDVLLKVFDLAKKNEQDYQQALGLMLKAVLVSPQFLFITPAATDKPKGEIVPLDDYQLASRLSYLLWETMPDDELMKLADQGKLHESQVLQSQVKRMLMDRRSRALFDGFAAQWLGLKNIENQVFDRKVFPEMSAELRRAMYDEVRLFFEDVVREDKSVSTFIHAEYTFLNGTLAQIYGIENKVTGPAMRRVQLSDKNRGGILAMPGVLAATSFPNRTSPVNRGVWVLEQVLGDHVPPAPPDVPALDGQEKKEIESLSLRQRTELHRKNPVCANCHKILDPIGFGLENFDAIGRWREHDKNGKLIDATGKLPSGEEFSGPADLKTILGKRTDVVARNLTEKLLAYALCRNLDGYDEIVVDGLMEDIAADGYRMQSLVRAVVTSYPFTHRRIDKERSP